MITERAVLGMFYERLMQDTAASWIDAICTPIIDSDQDSEEYAWLGMVPQLTEKKGEKKFSQLRETDWIVDNVEYQGGIVLPKKHILYDKTGQVRVRVNEMADRARAQWYSLIAPLIVNGPAALCYDGQYFFDTDHAEGDSGTQSNAISVDISLLPTAVHGSVTSPSAAEMVHSIMKGVEQIISFKDDRGEYCNENLTEFLVLVPTTLLIEAASALKAVTIDGGDTNILLQQDSFNFRVQASPRLSAWTDSFALFAAQGNQKPIIRQQRIPNNATPGFPVGGMILETLWLESEHCKKHDECLVSLETERAAAYGDWKKACRITMV